MPRFAIGVTLTPEERASMKLPILGSTAQPLSRVSSHEMSVVLPDGTTCPVTYQRFGACSHRFLFGEPLREAVWVPEAMNNYPPAIERKALELAPQAFAQAMAEEQRLMRCKTIPRGSTLPPGEPQMQAKSAATLAGCYAVCLLFSNGRLTAVGTAFSSAKTPIADLQAGAFDHVQLHGAQRLVIGICCRYLRRWIEPRLLPVPRGSQDEPNQSDGDEAA